MDNFVKEVPFKDKLNELDKLRVENTAMKSACYWAIETLEGWHKKPWVSIFVRDFKIRSGLE